ncbi:MAG: hypothetical protein D6685_16225, partial [Bacteroidetes bacterium]
SPDASPHDIFADFMNRRQTVTGRLNPLILGTVEDWKKIDPDGIGVVVVPRRSILDTGALVTDLDSDNPLGLNEMRVYGDVPLRFSKMSPAPSDVQVDEPVKIRRTKVDRIDDERYLLLTGGLPRTRTNGRKRKKRGTRMGLSRDEVLRRLKDLYADRDKGGSLIPAMIVAKAREGGVTKAARDGDGDGFVYDGTPRQRPAIPHSIARAISRARGKNMKASFSLTRNPGGGYVAASRRRRRRGSLYDSKGNPISAVRRPGGGGMIPADPARRRRRRRSPALEGPAPGPPAKRHPDARRRRGNSGPDFTLIRNPGGGYVRPSQRSRPDELYDANGNPITAIRTRGGGYVPVDPAHRRPRRRRRDVLGMAVAATPGKKKAAPKKRAAPRKKAAPRKAAAAAKKRAAAPRKRKATTWDGKLPAPLKKHEKAPWGKRRFEFPKGARQEAVDDFAVGFSRMMEEWPVLERFVGHVKLDERGQLGLATVMGWRNEGEWDPFTEQIMIYGGNVLINPEFMKQVPNFEKPVFETGAARTWAGAIAHELAHALTAAYSAQHRREKLAAFGGPGDPENVQVVWEIFMDSFAQEELLNRALMGRPDLGDLRSTLDIDRFIREHVSEYGASDPSEAVAELFALGIEGRREGKGRKAYDYLIEVLREVAEATPDKDIRTFLES